MEFYLGQIIIGGWNFPPRGTALCDGQLMAISQNSALFSLLGTTYGGDGRSSFGLPDLRGRMPMHPGDGPGLRSHRLGERGGQEQVTLTQMNLPSHDHALLGTEVNVEPATQSRSTQTVLGQGQNSVNMRTQNAGGGQPINNMSPYLCVNFCIVMQGIFPSRS